MYELGRNGEGEKDDENDENENDELSTLSESGICLCISFREQSHAVTRTVAENQRHVPAC